MNPVAWMVRYGAHGEFAAFFLDEAKAMQAAADLHGRVYPLGIIESQRHDETAA